MHPGDRHYRNETIRLADLTVVTDVIAQVTFENCIIEGPAVVLGMNGTLFNKCRWESAASHTFWPLDDDRVLAGAVILDGCNLYGCSLRRIGLALPRERYIEMMRSLPDSPVQ